MYNNICDMSGQVAQMVLMMECDRAYVEQVIVFLESFFEFHKNTKVNLVIADRDWDDKSRRIVDDCLKDHKGVSQFVDIRADLEYFGYPVKDVSIMLSVFAIAERIDFDKILYVDVDMIVNGSLEEVWNTELGDNLIAGTLDYNIDLARAGSGLGKDDIYFNTGVALINLKAMRKYHIRKKTHDYIRYYNIRRHEKAINEVTHSKAKTWEIMYYNANCIYLHDQGIWSRLARGKMLVLHPKYNVLMPEMLCPIEELVEQWRGFWSGEDIAEAREHPVVIHFSGNKYCKPWNKGCEHPYKDLYILYRDRTRFKGAKLLEGQESDRRRKQDWVRKLPERFQYFVYKYGYMKEVRRKKYDSDK